MPIGAPRIRFWQSGKITLQGAAIGFDALKVLAKAREPQSVTDLSKSLGYRKQGVQSALLANVLVVLHKAGAVEGDGKIGKLRLASDLTKVSITEFGRRLMNESHTRLEFGRRLIEKS